MWSHVKAIILLIFPICFLKNALATETNNICGAMNQADLNFVPTFHLQDLVQHIQI